MFRRIARWKWWIAAAVVLLFLAWSRSVYSCRYLFSWDSVSFALSLDRYDVRLQQPHSPGYILYCFAIRILNVFTRDPNLAMILLNVVATAAGAFFLARLVWTLTAALSVQRRFWASTGAALLYVSNPVCWLSSSVAEIYPVEGFFVSWIGYLFATQDGSARRLMFMSVAMALAGGFRPSTEALLLPLYVMEILRHSPAVVKHNLALLILANTAWFLPMVALSGGFWRYLFLLKDQFGYAAGLYSALFDRAVAMTLVLRVLQATTLPVLAALVLKAKRIQATAVEKKLLLSALLSAVLLALVHLPRDGYLLIAIPLLISIPVVQIAKLYTPTGIAIILMLGFAANYKIFVQPELPRDDTFMARAIDLYHQPNKWAIHGQEHQMDGLLRFVKSFPENRKILICSGDCIPNWRLVSYYLPQCKVYRLLKNGQTFVSQDREVHRVRIPVHVGESNGMFITLSGASSAHVMRTAIIEGTTYSYTELTALPRSFRIDAVPFVRARNPARLIAQKSR